MQALRRLRAVKPLIVCAYALFYAGCNTSSQTLTVFNAAALGPPFRIVSAELSKGNPPIVVAQENSPSLEAVRKLTDLRKIPDILAVADVALVDSLVIGKHADWYVVFGTNALVLAYTDRSAHHQDLTTSNWPDILLKPGVRTGRSDPRIDPSGYRALMALDLAERFYRRPGLASQLRDAMPLEWVRHAEADLSALVSAGEIDYAWTYRSLARAHGLRWVELPREINLEDPELASWYAQVSVDLPGSAAGPPLRLSGQPILFALTIPRDAPHPALAARFVEYLFSNVGRARIEATGFRLLASPRVVGSNAPSFVPR